MPATASFDKGAIEEWTDLRFFRPLGLAIARAAMPTRISPDALTGVALVLGLVAGHLCFYDNPWINAAGVILFVVSDIFDSADGQLARMRGTATRLGKMLDGLADGARFINLYINLMLRLLVSGDPAWLVIPLILAAGVAHAYQSAAIDYIRQLYLYIGEGGAGEFALPEDLGSYAARGRFERFKLDTYRDYLERNGRLVPTSVALVRQLRAESGLASIGGRWAAAQRGVLRQCAWIGQNIRFALLAVTVVPGHPAAFAWITLVPMTAIMVLILLVHERHAAAFLPPSPSQLAEAA